MHNTSVSRRLARALSILRASRGLALAAALSVGVSLGLAGCSESGGRSGGTNPAGGSTVGGGTVGGGTVGAGSQSGASQAHWQVALAALAGGNGTGLGGSVQALTLTQAGFDAWNDQIARSWPEVHRQIVDPRIEQLILTQLQALGGGGGAIRVLAVRDLVIDTSAPPAVRGSTFGTRADLQIELPEAPRTWTLGVTVDVGAVISTQIFGFPIQTTISLDARAVASSVRVSQHATLDLTDPLVPRPGTVSPPVVDLQLTLSSQSPLLGQVLTPLTQLLEPVIRVALVGGAVFAQTEVMRLVGQVSFQPWGTGLAPAAPVTGSIDLEAHAIEISDRIQQDHMPWGTVLPAIYDQPGYGNGQVVGYYDHGDSAGWTNSYVMGEAIRYDLTQDPRALAGAIRGLDGTLACLEVSAPGDGLLSRCAVPMHDPLVQQITGSQHFFVGSVNGVPHGGLGDMSRDHYIESLMGVMQAWLRVPALRPRVHEIVTRMIDYLERNEWNVFVPQTNRLATASPFAQAPGAVWAFAQAGNALDPARYGALFDRYKPLTSILWLNAWASAVEVHLQYFKFNLGHAEAAAWCALETDPARYRDYFRVLQLYRSAIGHHDNAWFDSVYGMAVPPAAPVMAPRVRASLERWTVRDRRVFPVDLVNDTSIVKVLYSAVTYPVPELIAITPIPIEKRAPNDFIWQRSPFELTIFHSDPRRQYPGIDLTLPYWTARAYGIVR